MSRIAVCICTYKRPAGLKGLLRTLEQQRFVTLLDSDVQVIVIDNDSEGSAAKSAAVHGEKSRFRVRYVHEMRKGLSSARNAALEAASEAEFIAFIDDDEVPSAAWLETLHRALIVSGAAAAVGPVVPIFETTPPGWAIDGGFYAKRLPDDNGLVKDAYTCNVMIATAEIRMAEVRFDETLNEIGGEDTMFFRDLLDRGGRIVWCANAPVSEWISPERMRLSWLLKRWYRTGNIEARLGRGAKPGAVGRIINVGRGLARIGVGLMLALLAAISGWRNPSRVVSRLYTICRGGGLIASALGRDYREYSRSMSYR